MEKRLKNYLNYMDKLLENAAFDKGTREQLIQEHLIQIGFFQHERLIHLIVTVVFALLEMLSLIMVMVAPDLFTFLLPIVVLGLLVPYIRHYYILENGVQKMYGQYDRLCDGNNNS